VPGTEAWQTAVALGLLGALALVAFAVVGSRPERPARLLRAGLATLAIAGILLGLGAALEALVDLIVTDDDLARYSGVFAFAVALAIVLALFVPFGVLSQALPIPSQRAGTALIGAGAITWLLVVAYQGMAAAGWVSGSDAVRALVLLAPTAAILIAYAGRGLTLRTLLALAIPTAFNLVVLGILLWDEDVGPNLTLAVAAFVAAALVAAIVLQGPGGLPALVTVPVSVAAGVLVAWQGWGLAPDDPARVSAAVLLGVVITAVAATAAFILVRQGGPLLAKADWFVSWLGRPGADPWSLFERTEPPLFKSFLEVNVTGDAATGPTEIRIDCWGVSGFEADADRPILVDRVVIRWPETAP
jgi:hypothetical protein